MSKILLWISIETKIGILPAVLGCGVSQWSLPHDHNWKQSKTGDGVHTMKKLDVYLSFIPLEVKKIKVSHFLQIKKNTVLRRKTPHILGFKPQNSKSWELHLSSQQHRAMQMTVRQLTWLRNMQCLIEEIDLPGKVSPFREKLWMGQQQHPQEDPQLMYKKI